MLKHEEIALRDSCLNRARPDEHIFILLGRDLAAPATIRFWCKERVRIGKNKTDSRQILEALTLAQEIESLEEDMFPKPWKIDPNF